MVHLIRSLIGAAALISLSSAAPMPRPDSAIGQEVAVSAPDGVVESDTPTATSEASSTIDNSNIAVSTMVDASSQTSAPSSGSSGSSWSSSSSSQPPDSSWSSSSSYSPPASDSSWSSSSSYSAPSYGSGSSSWSSSSGYNDCVQQCSAQYGSPGGTPPSSTEQWSGDSSSGSSGSGATHTVIVAPTQGVLRYIPFSVNASVGDTVSFKWGAGPHTVTQSSALEVCNKTAGFASGMQQKGFVFNQVINNTNPIWFYCGVPTHCQKGMFGGINIGQPDPTGNYMSLGAMIPNMTTTNSDMSQMWSYTKSQTGSNEVANAWGMNINVVGMDQNAMMEVAQNVLWTQTVISTNPGCIKDGHFDSTAVKTWPPQLDAVLASKSASASSTSSSASGAASASPAPTKIAGNAAKSGAGSIASSSVAVGLAAVAATFFAL